MELIPYPQGSYISLLQPLKASAAVTFIFIEEKKKKSVNGGNLRRRNLLQKKVIFLVGKPHFPNTKSFLW